MSLKVSQQQVPLSFQDKRPKEVFPLAVDASTSPLQVGIPKPTSWHCLVKVNEHALEGIFSATEKVLKDSKKNGNFSIIFLVGKINKN